VHGDSDLDEGLAKEFHMSCRFTPRVFENLVGLIEFAGIDERDSATVVVFHGFLFGGHAKK
jgi:hypothetical protein